MESAKEKDNREKCYITLSANAGLALSVGDFPENNTLLIDAFHKKAVGGWSYVTPKIYGEMKQSIAFRCGKALFITHGHGDHFSLEMTVDFIKNSGIRRIVSTQDVKKQLETAVHEGVLRGAALRDGAFRGVAFKEADSHLEGLEILTAFDGDVFNLSDLGSEISVKAFKATHDGEKFAQVPHVGYIMGYKGKSILATGDAELCGEDIKRAVKELQTNLSSSPPSDLKSSLPLGDVFGGGIDLAIVNFPWVTLPRGREFLMDVIRPKSIAICHIPFSEDDRFGYLKATLRAVEKLPKDLDVRIMERPMQQELFYL